MNSSYLSDTILTYSQGHGVTVSYSREMLRITLPRPLSRRHALDVASVLWDTWSVVRCQVIASRIQCTVDVSAIQGLPITIVSILASIDRDLQCVGRQLRIIDGPVGLPSHARCVYRQPKSRPHRPLNG